MKRFILKPLTPRRCMQFNPPQRHALAWGAITLVVGVVLWVLGPVLMPFVVAAVLAYALNPLVRGLERLG